MPCSRLFRELLDPLSAALAAFLIRLQIGLTFDLFVIGLVFYLIHLLTSQFEVELFFALHFSHFSHFSLHLKSVALFDHIYLAYLFAKMVFNFPTNGDFDSWKSSAKPKTVKQYVDWISDYAEFCRTEGLTIHDGQSVKLFLVFRHNTPKVAKRSNKRQKVKKGEGIKQKTGELYSILSAIKCYFSMFNLKDPIESHPTIANMLSLWAKEDPPVLKSPIFEGEEIEMFCAYADNSDVNLVCKAVVLMYIACAGRVGELHDILWEDVRQVNYDGQMVWVFSYFKEKQDGTPEKVDSMLGDEVSNMVFNLYAGIIFLRTCCCFTCVYNVVFLDCFLPEERVGRLLRKLKWDYESDRYRATWKPVGKG